jgi:hypothetical protein
MPIIKSNVDGTSHIHVRVILAFEIEMPKVYKIRHECSRFSVMVEVVGSIFIFFLMRFVFSFAEPTDRYICVLQIKFEDENAEI